LTPFPEGKGNAQVVKDLPEFRRMGGFAKYVLFEVGPMDACTCGEVNVAPEPWNPLALVTRLSSKN